MLPTSVTRLHIYYMIIDEVVYNDYDVYAEEDGYYDMKSLFNNLKPGSIVFDYIKFFTAL